MLKDEEIVYLVSVAKIVASPKAKTREQKKSLQSSYKLESECQTYNFELYTRQNTIDEEHYSCGLVYLHPSGASIPLLRYNGSNHDHRNPLEGNELIRFKCHIHMATERYIELGDKAEKFARTTDRYSNLHEALECLLLDCNISGMHTSPPDDVDDGRQYTLPYD